jgi:hypothetical protein
MLRLPPAVTKDTESTDRDNIDDTAMSAEEKINQHAIHKRLGGKHLINMT